MARSTHFYSRPHTKFGPRKPHSYAVQVVLFAAFLFQVAAKEEVAYKLPAVIDSTTHSLPYGDHLPLPWRG